MTTKLKIDLSQGILEVEGSETFVKAIYSDFKLHFIGDDAGEALATPAKRRRRALQTAPKVAETQITTPAKSPPTTAVGIAKDATPGETTLNAQAATTPQRKQPAKKILPTYTFVDNLELTAQGDRASLVEFMDNKFPITNEERNLVFLYYLQYLLKTKPLTIDHVFTCYKAAKIRIPLNLEDSLQTTAGQRRWIKKSKTGRLSVTPAGKLYVEKQLPKKLKN